METIKERALRFINDDFESPLKDLLTSNNRTFLHINRMKIMDLEELKILHKKSPVYLQYLVKFKVSNYISWRENQAQAPRLNSTIYGLRTFRDEAVWIGNNLSIYIRNYSLFSHLNMALALFINHNHDKGGAMPLLYKKAIRSTYILSTHKNATFLFVIFSGNM